VQVCNIFLKKFLKAQLFIYSDLAKFQFSASPPPPPFYVNFSLLGCGLKPTLLELFFAMDD
jgi:hypothetical protein